MTPFQRFLIEYCTLPLLALIVAVWLVEEFVREHWLALGAAAVIAGVTGWLL